MLALWEPWPRATDARPEGCYLSWRRFLGGLDFSVGNFSTSPGSSGTLRLGFRSIRFGLAGQIVVCLPPFCPQSLHAMSRDYSKTRVKGWSGKGRSPKRTRPAKTLRTRVRAKRKTPRRRSRGGRRVVSPKTGRSIRQFLVVGAGASFGARDGPERPPLGAGLGEYLLNWLRRNRPVDFAERTDMDNPHSSTAPSPELWEDGIDDRLVSFLNSAMVDFEAAAGRMWEEEPELLEWLHRLLTWSMLLGRGCRFPQQADRYDELLLALPGFGEGTAIITPNYDILIEEALIRAGREFHYPGARIAASEHRGVPIYKIHGSINWLVQMPYAVSHDLEIARSMAAAQPSVGLSGPAGDQHPETHREYVPPGGRDNLILELKRNSSAPVLAVYAPRKPVPVNFEAVAGVLSKVLGVITTNKGAAATIVGLRLQPREDDPRLHDIVAALAGLRGPKVYVARGDEERERARSLGFEVVAGTFEEFLGSFHTKRKRVR